MLQRTKSVRFGTTFKHPYLYTVVPMQQLHGPLIWQCTTYESPFPLPAVFGCLCGCGSSGPPDVSQHWSCQTAEPPASYGSPQQHAGVWSPAHTPPALNAHSCFSANRHLLGKGTHGNVTHATHLASPPALVVQCTVCTPSAGPFLLLRPAPSGLTWGPERSLLPAASAASGCAAAPDQCSAAAALSSATQRTQTPCLH